MWGEQLERKIDMIKLYFKVSHVQNFINKTKQSKGKHTKILTSASGVAVGALPVQIISAVTLVGISMTGTTSVAGVTTLRTAARTIALILNGLQSGPAAHTFIVRVNRGQCDFIHAGFLQNLVQVGAVPLDHDFHIVEFLADYIAVLQNFGTAGLEGLQCAVDGVLVGPEGGELLIKGLEIAANGDLFMQQALLGVCQGNQFGGGLGEGGVDALERAQKVLFQLVLQLRGEFGGLLGDRLLLGQ